MMLPPSILRLRVVDDGHKKIGLWLPLLVFITYRMASLLAII